MDNHFDKTFLPVTSVTSGIGQAVMPDIFCLPIQIVNVFFWGNPTESREFVLIDAGMPHSADDIIAAAKDRFGMDFNPKAIVLTHGHFDHVGALADLTEQWNVPVYAHELELPYLTGQQNYPKPDPTVDEGLVAKMSPMFPNHGINLSNRVEKLPSDGSVPFMPGWRWIHSPGHTPGHVSFFREEDRTLIAGDAFVTVKQESLYKVITQAQEISGPPKYFTTDWKAAKQSVETLAALQPLVAVTGHGLPMTGEELAHSLAKLVQHFDEIAIPEDGRYVD
ncbi:MBL fold metallo-hydrolase [Bacillus songklensis]|uniref:MBL fold metallo-hydrolase n=1 Tax=Bacillus songklensis TaxID=1069116 RepID=A0ABV8B949_9BACI